MEMAFGGFLLVCMIGIVVYNELKDKKANNALKAEVAALKAAYEDKLKTYLGNK